MSLLSAANEKVFSHFIKKTESYVSEEYSEFFTACIHAAKYITEYLLCPDKKSDLGFCGSELEGLTEHEVFNLYDLSLAFFSLSMDGPNIPGSHIERVDQLKKLLTRTKWSDFLISQIMAISPEWFSGDPNKVLPVSERLTVQLEAYAVGVDRILGVESNHMGLYTPVLESIMMISDRLGIGSSNDSSNPSISEQSGLDQNPIMIGEQTVGEFIVTSVVFLLTMLAVTAVGSGVIYLVFDVDYWKTFGGVMAVLFTYMAYINAIKAPSIGYGRAHPASIIFPIVMALLGVLIFAR